jgi:hypothetical protein
MEDDQFGRALVFDCDALLVGVPGEVVPSANAGVVLSHEIDGLSIAIPVRIESASAPVGPHSSNDEFGFSVDCLDGLVVAGSPGDQSGEPLTRIGSVYQALNGQTIVPHDGAALDRFGEAVATDGVRFAVGAPLHDWSGSMPDVGATYIYEPQGGSWTGQKIEPLDLVSGDRFGGALALSSARLVVGAEDHDLPNAAGAGAVYVFEEAAGSWVQTGKLTAPNPAASDSFGHAVSIDGDRIAVGADARDIDQTNDGAVYVFRLVSGVWQLEATLDAPENDSSINNARFGWSLDIDNDQLIVGAFRATGAFSGAAYVYRLTATGWALESRLDPFDSTVVGEQETFGYSVAIRGDYAFCGAIGDDESANSAGAVFAFARCTGDVDSDGQTDLSDLLLVRGAFGCVGESCLGDVTGDGRTDLDDLLAVLGDFGCPMA